MWRQFLLARKRCSSSWSLQQLYLLCNNIDEDLKPNKNKICIKSMNDLIQSESRSKSSSEKGEFYVLTKILKTIFLIILCH